MSSRVNRRLFLQAGSAAGLGYLFTGPSFSVAQTRGANDRIRVAGIGVGGKGRSDIEQAGGVKDGDKALTEVVGLCDIDESDKHLGGAAAKFPKAETFFDFRQMFDKIGKTIDACTISTPDHTHALAAAIAIRAGKHVYVQKPLTRTVFEAHLLRKLAKDNKVCTQMGNQGTAENGLRRAVELIQAGVIGKVAEVHVWTNRPAGYWKQAPDIVALSPKQDIPKTVHWDEFIGPAPMRDYNKAYHPFAWRGYWDFGTGAIGDMACHTANMAFMALKLGHPASVKASAEGVNPVTAPSSANVVFQFPARGDMPAVTLNWYEGKKDGKKLSPPDDLLAKVLKKGEKLVDSGSILIGDKGILYSPNDYGASFRITPDGLTDGMQTKKPEKLAVNGGGDAGHKREWVEAIKANDPKKAYSNFDYASYLTAAFLLGNVAIRTGKGFDFNGETLECKGCPEAAKFIKAEYRKGWDMLEAKA